MNVADAHLRVLAIDTSTEMCSAAVLMPGGECVLRAVLTERSHAELILPMVDEVVGDDPRLVGRHPGALERSAP